MQLLPQDAAQLINNSGTLERLPRGAKTDRIFRILLCHPQEGLTKYRIAKLAHAQETHVYLLLRKLQKLGLVEDTRVTNHKELLSEWSRLTLRYESRSYMLKDILNSIKNTNLDYALTTYQAETKLNHYLFPSITDLYIRVGEFDKWHEFLVSEGALVGGGNVRLRWYDDHTFYYSFMVNHYRMVSVPQLIVDLIREGSVAVQAAEMMSSKYYDFLRFNENEIRSKRPLDTPTSE